MGRGNRRNTKKNTQRKRTEKPRLDRVNLSPPLPKEDAKLKIAKKTDNTRLGGRRKQFDNVLWKNKIPTSTIKR